MHGTTLDFSFSGGAGRVVGGLLSSSFINQNTSIGTKMTKSSLPNGKLDGELMCVGLMKL